MLNAGARASFFAAIAAVVVSATQVGAAHAQDASDSSGIDAAIAAAAYETFYLRADLGVGRLSGEPGQQDLIDNGGSFVDDSIGRNAVLMGGIGWQSGNGLRFDVTGEYRTKAAIEARDSLTVLLNDPDGTLLASTLYSGNLDAFVGLLNGYWDIAKFNGVTPYIGAGIGLAHSETSGVTTQSTAVFTDANTGERTKVLIDGSSEPAGRTKLAWSLMAGASIDLSAGTKLDLGYRYLNLDAGGASGVTTGLLECNCGTVASPFTIDGLDSHEIRIGLRWQLDDAAARSRQPAE